MRLLQHLRPTPEEIEHLALAETEPARVEDFEPITRGPLVALLLLALVGLAALCVSPFRLLRALARRSSSR